uniref:Jacalin-type lectin domain-containing protein n=1 Tax=Neogobius melanostomus TaxID=47308 RepID=A0A8C6T8Z9_9GOBI
MFYTINNPLFYFSSMHYIILASLLAATAFAGGQFSSINDQVGSGSGTAYTLQGQGHITGVRVWHSGNLIYGFQLRFGDIWSDRAGLANGLIETFELWDDEVIVQVSGTWSHYIHSLQFISNRGRSLIVGLPSGQTFNMYTKHPKAELCTISGRYHGAITGFAAQWNVISNNII